ncbi:MAG: phage portal protein [Propionibacteriaceae bacterium]|jgi:hypothetical protein|nr:phage portal protein [Propionibacteriaceae bacterium]
MSLPDALIADLEAKLARHQAANRAKAEYYEGTHTPSYRGWNIPPVMKRINPKVGWPGIIVDTLEERLEWQGWNAPDELGLDAIYTANNLAVESGAGHLDALLYGTAFVALGTGQDDEPHPLITVESPVHTTGHYDRRTRRLSDAITILPATKEQPATLTLYLPDTTIHATKERGGRWTETWRDNHQLGRIPVVLLANRVRSSRPDGRSEITHPVRHYTDEAARVLLGMAVHREFFQAPQRWALGVNPEDFDADPWKNIMGHWLALDDADDGRAQPRATLGTFDQASPLPFIEQLRALAVQLAAEAGIPTSYLGIETSNPASADAIRAGEARLIKRAERRQAMFSIAWNEVARIALLIRDHQLPDPATTISCRWRDAATPTRAASADEASKLVGAGILPANSQIVLDRIGLTPAEQEQVTIERAGSSDPLSLLAGAIATQTQ